MIKEKNKLINDQTFEDNLNGVIEVSFNCNYYIVVHENKFYVARKNIDYIDVDDNDTKIKTSYYNIMDGSKILTNSNIDKSSNIIIPLSDVIDCEENSIFLNYNDIIELINRLEKEQNYQKKLK